MALTATRCNERSPLTVICLKDKLSQELWLPIPSITTCTAELDELRRISNEPHGNQPHSSTNLPHRMGNKT
ncbi:hypothetical protein RB195_025300 [Necator americanus]|uniref:Uncharacterized protein n=1 Tax=Necator americanus TaxID=51031 RepID=A0ABR1ERN6_NECAM